MHQDLLLGGIGAFFALSLLVLILVLCRRTSAKLGQYGLALAFVSMIASSAVGKLLPERLQSGPVSLLVWLMGIAGGLWAISLIHRDQGDVDK